MAVDVLWNSIVEAMDVFATDDALNDGFITRGVRHSRLLIGPTWWGSGSDDFVITGKLLSDIYASPRLRR